MNKLVFTVALLLMLGVNNSSSFSREVIRRGNTFTVASKMKQVNSTKTRFTWQDSKGVLYPIYISQNGACYVLRVSKKTNKEYKSYLGAEISIQICKELNIKYSSKSKK